jgi:Tn3 transposase DDE domain
MGVVARQRRWRAPPLREAHAALDAMLHHEPELPLREMMVDTAGFTDLMYALYDLEGFQLAPRIRDLPTLRLFPLSRPVDRPIDYGVLKPTPPHKMPDARGL